jgi:hypothetical protein
MAINKAMMAITTSNSISVNAFVVFMISLMWFYVNSTGHHTKAVSSEQTMSTVVYIKDADTDFL